MFEQNGFSALSSQKNGPKFAKIGLSREVMVT